MTKTDKIRRALMKDPDVSPSLLAKKLKVAPSAVYKIRKDMLADDEPTVTEIFPRPDGVVRTGVDATLDERAATYGKFSGISEISQTLKGVLIHFCSERETRTTESQREALEMIVHKIARIINGDPNHIDSWHDIAGYAQLVADQLRGIDR